MSDTTSPAVRLGDRLATREDAPLHDACPIERALQVVGQRTTLLLLREVLYGATRFDALVRRTGMTEAVAAQRLRALVEAGVLVKSPYREEGQRTRHEYLLTESGAELAPVLLGLLTWGERHTTRPTPVAVGLTHAACGEPVEVEVRCTAGHLVGIPDVVVSARR